MTKEEVKQRVCKAIVAAQPRLREIAESIMAEPELGYKEVKTSKKVRDMFDELGIPYTTEHALTGVKGRMKGRDSKYTVAMKMCIRDRRRGLHLLRRNWCRL